MRKVPQWDQGRKEKRPPSPVKRHPMSACWGSLLPGLPLVARHLQCSSFLGVDPLRGSGRTMDWVGAHMALRSGQSSRPGGCNVCRVVVSARKWQAPACSSWESLEDIVKSRKREFWIRLGGGRPTPWPWVGSSSRKARGSIDHNVKSQTRSRSKPRPCPSLQAARPSCGSCRVGTKDLGDGEQTIVVGR